MRIDAAAAQTFAQESLVALGCSPAVAATVAEHMIHADLVGYFSHGFSMLPTYAKAAQSGGVDATAEGVEVSRLGAISVWDGQMAFGHMAVKRATEAGIEIAKQLGVAAVAVRRSYHCARVGHFVEMAAEAGLASIIMANVIDIEPNVVPYGGRDPRLTTNPIGMGVPRPDGKPPVVLDFATAAMALNKVRVAHARGEQLPPGILVDADGNPTLDPGALFSTPPGAILPFGGEQGGHKGYALSVMIELLAGAVTGGGAELGQPEGKPRVITNNVLMVLMDPYKMGASAFEDQVRAATEWILGSRPIDPARPVVLPGELEAAKRAEQLAKGIDYGDKVWAQITATARELGVAESHFPVPVDA
ncbi:L-lactate dehydrogenase [Oryzomicrobium terrae]|uniref:L-lactate dehydrogenase n=1 Tax=Oryzomicrobium terrae TaxID=1735038 RepID=A0A5C1EBX9_9RHOO|nr:Ldh family oxidoreductase [Oryzomicrobium terrae]QEL66109.1 L-lactate dehydrogenase [Oryzomicrobium terrae]